MVAVLQVLSVGLVWQVVHIAALSLGGPQSFGQLRGRFASQRKLLEPPRQGIGKEERISDIQDVIGSPRNLVTVGTTAQPVESADDIERRNLQGQAAQAACPPVGGMDQNTLFACTNAFRANPNAFLSDIRAACPATVDSFMPTIQGRQALTWNAALTNAAQGHSQAQANYRTMTHQTPGEPDVKTRIVSAGYNIRVGSENVGFGYTGARGVLVAWTCSDGHRDDLYDCKVSDLGVGVAMGSDGLPYWTQNFGCLTNTCNSCGGLATNLNPSNFGNPGLGYQAPAVAPVAPFLPTVPVNAQNPVIPQVPAFAQPAFAPLQAAFNWLTTGVAASPLTVCCDMLYPDTSMCILFPGTVGLALGTTFTTSLCTGNTVCVSGNVAPTLAGTAPALICPRLGRPGATVRAGTTSQMCW